MCFSWMMGRPGQWLYGHPFSHLSIHGIKPLCVCCFVPWLIRFPTKVATRTLKILYEARLNEHWSFEKRVYGEPCAQPLSPTVWFKNVAKGFIHAHQQHELLTKILVSNESIQKQDFIRWSCGDALVLYMERWYHQDSNVIEGINDILFCNNLVWR